MKDKDLSISLLNQLYGNMLTEKQEAMLKAYYDFDFSLAEIADEYGISRQAVRDSIKRAETSLLAFEEKFRLSSRKANVAERLAELKKLLADKNLLDGEIQQKLLDTERALEGE